MIINTYDKANMLINTYDKANMYNIYVKQL